MTLIIETEVPDWVEWVVQDKDGKWEGHKYKPEPDNEYGDWNSWGQYITIGQGDPNPNWRESLYKIEVKE